MDKTTDLGVRKWWALAATTLAILAVGLDGTILSVALPTLAKALKASESILQWFSSGYTLVLAAAMLPAGLLGDLYGHKRVLSASLALFGIGSAACAYSTSSMEFIAARVILGLAGAGIIVMALSAITVLFDKKTRPKAVGVWGAANFLALPIGPILGGWLLTNYWWGWVFLMNVPVALVGLVAVLMLVPSSPPAKNKKVDLVGVILSATGLVALTYGMIQAGQNGWGSHGPILFMTAGVAVLVGFYAWERRLSNRSDGNPLVDLSLFSSASFTWGVLLVAVAVMAMIGVIFTMPQYFQGVLGTNAMGSGLRLLSLIGGLVVGAILANRLARFLGSKVTTAIGFGLLAAGLFIGATTKVDSTSIFIEVWMGVVGVGMGIALATASSAALVELTAERSGVGSAVLQAVNKTGGPFGVAILGSILTAGYLAHLNVAGLPGPAVTAARQSVFGGVAVAQQLGSGSLLTSVRTAFTYGMDNALVVSGFIAVAGIMLTLIFLPQKNATAKAE